MKSVSAQLVLIAAIGVGGILLNALTHSRGFLTTDSIAYLRDAAILTQSTELATAAGTELPSIRFVTWPFGYPIAIAAVAKVFRLEPFWAAKLLNSALLCCALLLIRTVLPRSAVVGGAVLLSGSGLSIFSHTWSEALFTVALLGLVAALGRVQRKGDLTGAVCLFLAATGLFLSRYVGVFSFGVLAYYALGFVRRRDLHRLRMVGACAVALLLIVVAYLYRNQVVAGALGSRLENRALESAAEFGGQALVAHLIELNYVYTFLPATSVKRIAFSGVLLLPVMWGLWCSYRRRPSGRPGASVKAADLCLRKSLVVTAVAYWSTLVGLRFVLHFDELDHRLLWPATLLLFLGLISLLESRPAGQWECCKRIVVTLSVLSVLYNAAYRPVQSYRHNPETFSAKLERLRGWYSVVPAGSRVLCASEHLEYLRPDLIRLPASPCEEGLPRIAEDASSLPTRGLYVETATGAVPAAGAGD